MLKGDSSVIKITKLSKGESINTYPNSLLFNKYEQKVVVVKVLLELFISPTCPYCPYAEDVVKEIANEMSDKLEYVLLNTATEKGQKKAMEYGIPGVPSIAIDNKLAIVGVPDADKLRSMVERAHELKVKTAMTWERMQSLLIRNTSISTSLKCILEILETFKEDILKENIMKSLLNILKSQIENSKKIAPSKNWCEKSIGYLEILDKKTDDSVKSFEKNDYKEFIENIKEALRISEEWGEYILSITIPWILHKKEVP